ncbi:MAG: hypothetical protein JF619_19325 [Massilia sp.]|nr:hypothetical protein [Massilia sp.]
MKLQIIHVGKLQAAKVAAVMYLILSIPLAAVMMLAPPHGSAGLGWGMFFLVVVMYVLAGAVFSFLGAWLYNGVVRLIGGIEFTVVEVEQR